MEDKNTNNPITLESIEKHLKKIENDAIEGVFGRGATFEFVKARAQGHIMYSTRSLNAHMCVYVK